MLSPLVAHPLVMPWISYAQNREDVLLRRVFGDAPSGFYIDVGACDPVHLSITKHFYDLGWRGINVDASPPAWARMKADRPRDVNLNVGVSNRKGSMTFYRAIADAHGGDASGLSTFVAEEVEVHKRAGFVFEELVTPVTTLAAICEEHVRGPIDFVSIDVEGHEREVLEGADLRRYRPRVVLVEATRPKSDEPTHQRWEGLLLEADYLFATFDGLNRYYVRAEDRDVIPKLTVPPNVFDDFVPWEYQSQIDRLKAEIRALRAERPVVAAALDVAKFLQKQAKRLRDRRR